MRLQDKVCIITGGAAGIGKATAVKFAAEGAKVVICDVNEEAGNALAAELGNDASFWKVNVVNRQEVQEWIDAVAAKYGRIDALINNAGITRDSQFVKFKGRRSGRADERRGFRRGYRGQPERRFQLHPGCRTLHDQAGRRRGCKCVQCGWLVW